jgi:two-component system cell cycle sensor histidine kinase/response regulator CckA
VEVSTLPAPLPFQRRPLVDPSLCGSETILVVDDEKFVRDYCTSVLSYSGYEVLAAEDGNNALEMVRSVQKPIDLALIDIRMPKMSGPELLVELLDCLVPRNLQIRFILMSGFPDTRGDPAHSAKRYSFVQKPFTASVLLTAVRQELDAAVRVARGNGNL